MGAGLPSLVISTEIMVTLLSFTSSFLSYCSGHIPNVCQAHVHYSIYTKTVPCNLDPRYATEICVTGATMLCVVHSFFGS